MTPKLDGIDHIHIKVASWSDAEKWYQEILGFRRVDALMSWAIENGPLTIENPEGNIHLALFEANSPESSDAVAFGASAAEFMAWNEHLQSHGLDLRLADHTVAYSLYFSDPWGNLYEISTHERNAVAKQLAKQD